MRAVHQPPRFRGLAQSAERLSLKEKVESSNLSSPANISVLRRPICPLLRLPERRSKHAPIFEPNLNLGFVLQLRILSARPGDLFRIVCEHRGIEGTRERFHSPGFAG